MSLKNFVMEKLAEVTTPLSEHQQRVVDKLKENNVLIAHGMGSGKTLSSIAAADALKRPTKVLVPASLVNNYKKEIEKHTTGDVPDFDIESINTAISRDKEVTPEDLLIVDEAHMARNPSSQRSKWLEEKARKAGRVALLTGTPVYNNISDLAPIINILHGKKVVPENPVEFEKMFITETKKDPNLFMRLFGIKPGVIKSISPSASEKLKSLLKGKVDVYENKEDMPLREDIVKKVPLSSTQQRYYNYLLDVLPWHMRYKIKSNLPPSKQESRGLNSYLTGIRQVGLSTAPYDTRLSALEAGERSSKLTAALESIKEKMEKDKNFKSFVYSNFLEAGLNPMKALLDKENIPSGVFHGGLTKEKKKELVDAYNNGLIKVLLGSSSATEGLDLKGTKLIQVLEPHFNNPKVEQAIARGIRRGSHKELPEEERKVLVEKYLSTNRPSGLERLFGITPNISADEWLSQRASEKDTLTNAIKKILEEA